MKHLFIAVSLIVFIPFIVSAEIINVPADIDSIQGGINMAADGDTVLVAENTYYENINFKGKAITVASHFIMDGDTSHISKTIIDGSQHTNPDSGSVVYMIAGEDTTSVLIGFTITGGTGTFQVVTPPDGPSFDARTGGGIYVTPENGASIVWNIIENNHIITDKLALGGGISAGKPDQNPFMIIENNVIQNNSISGEMTYVSGGAIFMGSSGRIINNTIINNMCHSVNNGVAGGAIRFLNMEDVNGAKYCLIENNVIKGNLAVSENNNSFGGGVMSAGIRITLRNNRIINNTAKGHYDYSGGGGLYIGSLLNGQHVIDGNLFSGNMLDGAYYGGGIALYNSAPRIVNNIFSENSARFGGGLFLDNSSKPEVVNNTFYENSASSQGGGIYSRNSTLYVMNSIIWNNTALTGLQIYRTGGSAAVVYSDVQGGYTGEGNINANPLFEDTLSFKLSESSLCIGAGKDSIQIGSTWYVCPDCDIWGNPRPDPAGSNPDMGACESPLGTDIEDFILYPPKEITLEQNYPNPFNPVTTIRYVLPVACHAALSVYNILGEKVATLVAEKQPAGTYKVEWDASGFASGIYFYQLKTDKGFMQTKKLLVLQ